ncbi:Uncharacterized protein FKW44_021122 [Caligus rogercresseyi]|uniref:Uncharacterized protein n=1 Tax=Caligus rogercresseyi TaxID=217165 RepID=A0A7T8GQS1_CALRO|nr:Uncharacterized protein FKW44_021122 [Caligus rogercresseyi]
MADLCGLENGQFSAWSAKWVHKVSLLSLLWDSRARIQQWRKKNWPERESLEVGTANVINEPLIPRDIIIFPPLHIKLGLMK